jgi:A/G-specific adenine glycosylase
MEPFEHSQCDDDELNPATGMLEGPATAMLEWYDKHRRAMPWRVEPGASADPYRVWLSEIMLQQTTVVTVGPYFERFLARWPTVGDLAAAKLDDVLHAWQGLGYYARARNMHKCARQVSDDYGGMFPDTEESLRELPGIGQYTSAAIASIAFGRRAVVVDGNVERVMARYFAIDAPLPKVKPRLYEMADLLTPVIRAGDYAQSVMDLGATICTPRSPKCLLCPLSSGCKGQAIADTLPKRLPKKAKPTRRGVVFWLTRSDGAVLLRRRPESGLLGGMMEAPSSPWVESPAPEGDEVWDHAPVKARKRRRLPGVVLHGFTHFHLELIVYAGRAPAKTEPPLDSLWCPVGDLGRHALPTLMRKVAAHVSESSSNSKP